MTAVVMPREWTRGRAAHASGSPKTANPHAKESRGWAAWLAGWLYQDERRKALDAWWGESGADAALPARCRVYSSREEWKRGRERYDR